MKYIFRYIREKPIDFALFVGFLAVCFILVVFVGDYQLAYLTAVGYFVWSLIYHYRRGDLHLAIVIEYLMIALLGVVVLSSIALP